MKRSPQIIEKLTGQHGAVAILTAILFIVLLGFAAFAIDVAYTYMIKAELQNAADAAALAGASVMFTDNKNCIASGRPYECCSGSKSGSCDPFSIDGTSIISTASAVALLNSKNNSPVPTPTVEIGHYTFPPTWGGVADDSNPDNFTENTICASGSCSQLSGWVTMDFATLNSNTGFINAVKATVTRTNVPRFFSRIWSSAPLTVSVYAIAYVGFANSIEPGTADQPIAICKQSITDAGGNYTACNTGRMNNSGSNASTFNTSAWTNFTTPCETANPPTVKPFICGSGNPIPIFYGSGIGATGGTDTSILKDLRNCFGPKTRTTPLSATLPVIDCPGNNPSNCSTVVGVVHVDIVWISEKDADTEDKFAAEDFPPSAMGDWTCPSSCAGSRLCCWNNFVSHFKLENVDGITATYAAKSIYFLPSCIPYEPTGGTGGHNYGVLAQFPVLVK